MLFESIVAWPDPPDHMATGLESLREFAENAGMDNPDKEWLLDDRDVWVKNPYYSGPSGPHPEDDPRDDYVPVARVENPVVEPQVPDEDLPF